MQQPLKIILIDDSFTTNFLNKMVIQKSKFDIPVEVFEKPKDGLEYLTNNHLNSSGTLIFVDINMPGMDGWRVIEELQKNGIDKGNVIVMLTSSIDPKDQVRALEEPAIHDFKTKPLTFDMLSEVIDRHFVSGSSSC